MAQKREEREKVRRRNVAWLILHDRGVRKELWIKEMVLSLSEGRRMKMMNRSDDYHYIHIPVPCKMTSLVAKY